MDPEELFRGLYHVIPEDRCGKEYSDGTRRFGGMLAIGWKLLHTFELLCLKLMGGGEHRQAKEEAAP